MEVKSKIVASRGFFPTCDIEATTSAILATAEALTKGPYIGSSLWPTEWLTATRSGQLSYSSFCVAMLRTQFYSLKICNVKKQIKNK
jgi:hypothetical protein